MDIIIPLLIVSVLIGIPTWLIVQTVNKADKSTIIYSPEEVTRRTAKDSICHLGDGFVIWSDSFVCSYTLRPLWFFNLLFRLQFVVGFIMFFIGRIQVGLMSRYINFCNREANRI